MTTMFEWNDDEPMLILNQSGERIKLADGASIYFDDLVGAHVKIMRRKEQVTCEASLPESKGIMRWKFLLSENIGREMSETRKLWRDENTQSSPPVRNLAALISEFRVGMNGRL